MKVSDRSLLTVGMGVAPISVGLRIQLNRRLSECEQSKERQADPQRAW